MQPTIKTEHLVLRPLVQSDAPRIQLLAGDWKIVEMTENIPHPYEDGMAEQWIDTLHPAWESRKSVTFGVCSVKQAELIGCCGLQISMPNKRASLGYWIGVDYWNKGFGTEAASAVVAFGFEELSLHRIQAQHLAKNPASGAVMRKIGMEHEATLVDYVMKSEQYENMELYAIFA